MERDLHAALAQCAGPDSTNAELQNLSKALARGRNAGVQSVPASVYPATLRHEGEALFKVACDLHASDQLSLGGICDALVAAHNRGVTASNCALYDATVHKQTERDLQAALQCNLQSD